MKAAIYLEDGTTQVVLTPENDWERKALRMIEGAADVKTFWANFYETRGGWFKNGNPYVADQYGNFSNDAKDDSSLMFRINKRIIKESEEFPQP